MDSDYEARFSGIARLYGSAEAARLRAAHFCVVGVGGVGSWAVEALARSGVGSLTLVDFDEVCISNVNRQLPALTSQIGKSKVRVLQERVAEISPTCNVEIVEEFFTSANAAAILARRFDVVLDAIDEVKNKALLISECVRLGLPIITAGGAGGRRHVTSLRIADLAFSSHDRLLTRIRRILRTEYGFPADPGVPFGVPCVHSTELPVYPQPDGTVCASRPEGAESRMNCNSGYGSATFVTGAFGFAAAAEMVRLVTATASDNTR